MSSKLSFHHTFLTWVGFLHDIKLIIKSSVSGKLFVIPLQSILHAVDRIIFLKHIPLSLIILNGFSVLFPVTYQALHELLSMPHLIIFPSSQKPPKSSHSWPTTISNAHSLSHITVAPSIWKGTVSNWTIHFWNSSMDPHFLEAFSDVFPPPNLLRNTSLWHQEFHYYRYFYALLCICQSLQLYCKLQEGHLPSSSIYPKGLVLYLAHSTYSINICWGMNFLVEYLIKKLILPRRLGGSVS